MAIKMAAVKWTYVCDNVTGRKEVYTTMYVRMWISILCISIHTYVTGFVKTCIVHSSDFSA